MYQNKNKISVEKRLYMSVGSEMRLKPALMYYSYRSEWTQMLNTENENVMRVYIIKGPKIMAGKGGLKETGQFPRMTQ